MFNACGFKFSATGQTINISIGSAFIIGGSVLADTPITNLVSIGNSATLLISGFDLSNCDAAVNISDSTANAVSLKLRNCKLPASWSGSVNSGTPGAGSVYELHNSDSADTNYRYQKKTQFGQIDSETTIVVTGGASDGTTALSHKMVSNADAEWNHQTLDGPEIVRWNETTGSAITATIEIIHSGVGAGGSGDFTDKEIWMEVQYLGTSGRPLSLLVDDAAADYITAAADQENSSATWTSSPATPVKQKLSVTFTPQEKGFIHAVVRLATASKTVYVDPKITMS
jgi:hypothetical protein